MNEEPPPILPDGCFPSGGNRWLPRLVVAGALLAGLVILFWFPPETTAYYPRCLLYVTTGWQCPGCGGLRAAHHLLHGDISTAYHYNALLVLLLPVALLWLVAPVFKRKTGLPWLDFLRAPAALIALLIIAVVFGIGRNLIH
jgi:hypothetical protein